MSKWFSCAKNLTGEGKSYLAEFETLKIETLILSPNDMEEKRLSCTDIQYNFPLGEIFSSLHDEK